MDTSLDPVYLFSDGLVTGWIRILFLVWIWLNFWEDEEFSIQYKYRFKITN